jgi:hypothetical protein
MLLRSMNMPKKWQCRLKTSFYFAPGQSTSLSGKFSNPGPGKNPGEQYRKVDRFSGTIARNREE